MGTAWDLRERTRNWIRKLRGRPAKHEEVRMLRPVALAGASRRSDAYRYSRLCSSFATTLQPSVYASSEGSDYYRERHEGRRRKAMSDGAEVHVEWRRCQMCERSFVVGVTPYKHHCSLDCKSASLLEEPVLLRCDDM